MKQFPVIEQEQGSTPHQALVKVLRKLRLFGSLSDDALNELAQDVVVDKVNAGDTVFDVGEVDDVLNVVLRGKVELLVDDEIGGVRQQHVISELRGSERDRVTSLLSLLEVLAGRDARFRSISGRAVEKSTILRIPAAAFRAVFTRHPDMLPSVLNLVLTKLHRITFLTVFKYLGLFSQLASKTSRETPYAHAANVGASGPAQTLEHVMAHLGIGEREIALLEDQGVDVGTLHAVTPFDADTVLIADSEQESSVYFVLTGRVGVYYRESDVGGDVEDADEPLYEVGPGGVVGHLSVLSGEPSLIRAVTLTDVTAVEISAATFWKLATLIPTGLLQTAVRLIDRVTPFVRQIDYALDWVEVQGGQTVYRQGDAADAIYIVLNGRLRSVVVNKGAPQVVTEFGRGEILGELEVLCGMERATTVHAVRDTELACLPRGAFRWIVAKYPQVAGHFNKLLGQRLLDAYRSRSDLDLARQAAPATLVASSLPFDDDPAMLKHVSTVALVALSDDVPLRAFSSFLTAALAHIGATLHLNSDRIHEQIGAAALKGAADYVLHGYLGRQEEKFRTVVYETDREATPWTLRCLRQADCILFVALGANPPTRGPVDAYLRSVDVRARTELVLLHHVDVPKPSNTQEWLNMHTWCLAHHHVRLTATQLTDTVLHVDHVTSRQQRLTDPLSRTSDLSRLARRVTGTSIGVVLGGGGAKGMAHIGVLRALEAEGVPVDIIGGTSMGAMIAAVYADEMDVERAWERLKPWSRRQAQLWRNVLQLTYPVTSMLTGVGFNRGIADVLGDTQIEDLWLPYFCVTTDITECKGRVHKHGTLWRYVRASMTLAGYFPPLCDPRDGHLLCDGGYVDNVPAEVMAKYGARTVIAIDVGSKFNTNFTNYGDAVSGWWLLWKKWFPWTERVVVPDLAEIEQRLAYIASEHVVERVAQSDRYKYIRPPIDAFSTFEFARAEEIERVGFEYGRYVVGSWRDCGEIDAMFSQEETSDDVAAHLNRRSHSMLDIAGAPDVGQSSTVLPAAPLYKTQTIGRGSGIPRSKSMVGNISNHTISLDRSGSHAFERRNA